MEGLAPPLADSEWVVGPPGRVARIVLQGLTGPIFVNGAPYKLEMPALPALSDADIASVMTYIRREWEHDADPVEEKLVTEVRAATKDRTDLWKAKELLEIN
jgi:mono/diheme cytochrome c family protein